MYFNKFPSVVGASSVAKGGTALGRYAGQITRRSLTGYEWSALGTAR